MEDMSLHMGWLLLKQNILEATAGFPCMLKKMFIGRVVIEEL